MNRTYGSNRPSQDTLIFTQLSDSVCSIRDSPPASVERLQAENTQYKETCESLRILNTTLKQALMNLSKKSKLDPYVIDQIKELSSKADQQTSCHAIAELQSFHQMQVQQLKENHKREVGELHAKFQDEIHMIKSQLDREYREKLSEERESMVRELRVYLSQEKDKLGIEKENKRGKQNTIKSSRRKNSSSFNSKNKTHKSPSVSLQSSSGKGRLRVDSEEQQSFECSIKRQKPTATEILCNNCYKTFPPNKFGAHCSVCRAPEVTSSRVSCRVQSQEMGQQDPSISKSNLLNQLINRKKEIEYQLQRIISRNSKEVLNTDQDSIVYIINNKSDLSVTEIESVLYNSASQLPHSACPKNSQVFIKRVN